MATRDRSRKANELMSSAQALLSVRLRSAASVVLLGLGLCSASCIASAQSSVDRPGPQPAAVVNDPLLPNAPSPQPAAFGEPVASATAKYIEPGWQAPPLDARGKVAETLHDLYAPDSFLGFISAAGYSQLVNGQPHYGVDRGAFGERLGAAAIRDSSQDLFTGAVFAPLLHQDTRYYVLGDGHSFTNRLLYAVSRSLITRNDDGRQTLNSSLLLGYGAAAALTDAYYPQGDRTAKNTVKTYGASIGGAAVGFAFHEFMGDALEITHLRKRQQQ
jgi:hypothetical protein